jgi:hypothetical protein
VSGCTGGGRPAGSAGGPASATARPLDAAIETCTQTDIGDTGRPGKFVYLAATDTSVQTQQGFEVVVHPARGDTHGKRWRLVVTGGSSHLCRLNGNFIPSVIAAFIIRSPGIITLDATGPSGARRLTIRASA